MRTPIPVEIRSCAYCGEDFEVRGYLTKTDRKKFCSKSCKHFGLAVHSRARKMSEAESAWFAGLFDGEGWVSWPDRKCLSTFRIGIASTSRPLLDKVMAVTGTGSITERPRTNPKHSKFWVWYCYSRNASDILSSCLEWLIVKREASEAALGITKLEIAPLTPRGLTQSKRAKV